MNQKLKSVTLSLIFIAVFGSMGFLIGRQTEVSPPASHQNVIDRMVVLDTLYDLYLVPKCVDAGQRVYAKGHSELAIFEYDRTYWQSTWLWNRYGDTEIAMTIWGPGEDGKTYSLEIAKLAYNELQIKISAKVKHTFSRGFQPQVEIIVEIP